MQAIVIESGAAHLRDVPEPRPGQGEVLIRVRLAGVCQTDLELLRGYGDFSGVPGHEFVGDVVDGSKPLAGKRVVGEINCVCGRCDMCASGLSNHCRRRTVLGIHGRGGVFAEFTVLPERNCHAVPESVTDEEAVFVEPLAAAFQITKQVKLEPRMNVTLLGTGRLGLLVAQVLALTGCRLTAVGRNPKTLGFLDRRRIRTIRLDELRPNEDQDLVVDCTGSPSAIDVALAMVRPRGTVVLKTTTATAATCNLTPAVVKEVTILGSRCGAFGEAIDALARKQIDVLSMVSRRMALSQGVEALKLASEPDNIKVLLEIAR